MAALVVEGNDVVVELSFLEKLGAVRGNVRVPLTAVRDVRVSADPWSELRGIRSPGTGWPGVIALGTRRGAFGADFAALRGKGPAVVIELDGAHFERLVVTTSDPEPVAAAIDSARPTP